MVTRKSRRWDKTQKERRKNLLKEICEELFYAESTSSTGKIPWGTVTRIINETVGDNPWINRNVINFSYKKYSAEKKQEALETASPSPSTTTVAATAGRPKGETNLMKHHRKEVVVAAKNEITQMYNDEKQRLKNVGQILPRGWLKETIQNVCTMRGIPDFVPKIKVSTIRNCTNMLIRQGGGSESLMRDVEPHLVDLIIAMARIRRCLTTSESMALANDLISGTKIEKSIIEWKKKGRSMTYCHQYLAKSTGHYSKRDGHTS